MSRIRAGFVSGVWIVLLLVFPLYQMSGNNVERGLLGENGSYETPLSAGYGSLSSGIRGVEWNRTYGGAGYDWADSVRQTSDGGYIVAGDTWSFGAGNDDAWLVKTDSVGNMEWNKTYGGAGWDTARCVVQTMDGGYAIAGSTVSFDSDSGGGWLVKTDSDGNLQWNKTYEGSEFESVVQTNDCGYAAAGYAYFYGTNWADFWLVKTDANGTMQWSRTYGGTKSDYAESLVQTTDEGYAIAGTACEPGEYGWDGYADFWLVKTDADGNMQWNKIYDRQQFDGATCVILTDDGGYALVGYTGSFGSDDIWFVKTDSSGNMQWSQTYGEGEARCIVQTNGRGYAMVGGSKFVETDSGGRTRWIETFGWGLASLVQTAGGGYAISGGTNSQGAGDYDFWLIKYSLPIRVHNINTGLGYTLIQDAIDAPETLEGHILKVDADTYYENVVINKNNLTLIGESPSTTIIDGGGEGNVVTITANNVTVSNFTIQHSGGYSENSGIYLSSVSDSKIISNSITDNVYFGVRLYFSSYNTLSENNITNSSIGIHLVYSNNNTVSSNAMDNTGFAVLVDSSHNNTVSKNTVIDDVICLRSSSNNIIFGNTAENIPLEYSSHNTLSGNTAKGVNLLSSSHNTIYNNTISNNSWFGLALYSSPNNVLKNNSIIGNRYNFYVMIDAPLSDLIQDIDPSNTVDGKPIYYWINRQNETVPADAGYVALINSTNIAVRELELKNNGQGILVAYTTNSQIINNTITDNYSGVYLLSSPNNTISGNNITDNNSYGNGFGVYLSLSSNNNKIYHNNFINNDHQAGSYDSTNVWDDGYPSGGNYWSDYAGTDLCNGPYQNKTGSDGVGDTSYIIDLDNQDQYPLKGPFTMFDAGTWNGVNYRVDVVSNSTISNFGFNATQKTITFNVTGPPTTMGFCRAAIPNALLGGPYTILVNGSSPLTLNEISNGTHTFLYFAYKHSTQQVNIIGTIVVPEFPSFIILPLFMIMTLMVLLVHRSKRSERSKLRVENRGEFESNSHTYEKVT